MRNWQTPSLVTGGRWWSPVSAVSELLLMSRFYQENIVIWDVGCGDIYREGNCKSARMPAVYLKNSKTNNS